MSDNSEFLNPIRSHDDETAWESEKGFATAMFERCMEILKSAGDPSGKVVDVYASPEKITSEIDFTLPKKPHTYDKINTEIDKMIPYMVRTAHPMFFNQLFSGLDPVAVSTQWFATTCNTSMYTYEVAPVFTMMEKEFLRRMREMIGWEVDADGCNGDGILSPGGSISNFMAINVSRHAVCPEIKTKGQHGKRLLLFASEQAHYSQKKAAAFLGIGTDNLIEVPCDSTGKMIPAEFDRLVKKHKEEDPNCVPFCVVATGGTTVAGAFDPLREISAIAKSHNMRMHVDGAFGGTVLFTERGRKLLDGIELADSVTWNPHKLMGIPQQCSAVLTKRVGELKAAHSSEASYLFQKDKNYAEYDTGDSTIQCGRLVDVLKVWTAWKARGDVGYERALNRIFELADYLRAKVEELDGFEMALEGGEFINVCFYYYPESIRAKDTPNRSAKLHSVAPFIKAKIQEQGSLLVGYQPINDMPQFFRMVVSNPKATEAEMDRLLSIIKENGDKWTWTGDN